MTFSYNVGGIRGAIVCAALSVIGSTAPLQAQESLAIVRVTSANLRADPSLQGAIVGRVVRGDTVRLIVEREDGWARVRARRSDAWIRRAFLVRQPQSEPSALPAPTSPSPGDAPAAQIEEPTAAVTELAPPTVAADDVDPRLAGRKRAAANGTSTIPASQDPSRLGVMAGFVTGHYSLNTFNGPAVRAFARLPIDGAPIAMRMDVEASRMIARKVEPALYRITDIRALLGAEYGVPLTDILEVSVVGSLGVTRQALDVGFDLDGVAHEYNETQWALAHDVGIGAKIARNFILEFHFFSSDGAPLRWLAGVRL